MESSDESDSLDYFYFFNNELQPLKFLFNWDKDDKFYFNIVDHGIGVVLEKADGHTMVLSNPKKCDYYHLNIPAFDVKYVKDCLIAQQFLDPRKYLIKKSCPIDYTQKDIYSCWFHHKFTWYDELPNYGLKQSNSNTMTTSVFTSISLKRKLGSDHISSNNRATTSTSKKHIEDTSDFDKPFKDNAKSDSKKRTRMAYTHKEDLNIVEYIVKNKDAFNVSGREMWQRMERAEICKIRTWQSMRERYLKHISHQLKIGKHKYPFLSDSDFTLLRQGLSINCDEKEKKLKKNLMNECRIDEIISDSESS
ncbi:uncharacterized protein LOC126894284 [Daktulosphaira vitifoliae]|uniref:uncharacterized protein LOC126894284 n=1 Tax=Daktulosphaira vitifoliae TaxID=58002 RepID=UPI0021A9C4EC|nr:uncharacterized protein LOC126894284 [Daktulosphaira vitifoliae]